MFTATHFIATAVRSLLRCAYLANEVSDIFMNGHNVARNVLIAQLKGIPPCPKTMFSTRKSG